MSDFQKINVAVMCAMPLVVRRAVQFYKLNPKG